MELPRKEEGWSTDLLSEGSTLYGFYLSLMLGVCQAPLSRRAG
jgi:hypothetical protein